jgi:hypothetical protein
LCLGGGLSEVRQNLVGALHEGQPRGGHGDSLVAAIEQPGAEFALQGRRLHDRDTFLVSADRREAVR